MLLLGHWDFTVVVFVCANCKLIPESWTHLRFAVYSIEIKVAPPWSVQLSISLIKHFFFLTIAVDVESSAGLTNTALSSHESFILFRLRSSQQCVCVYVLHDASDLSLCCQQRFLSFQEFHVGLMSEPTAIRLRLHHETYLAEMFTPGTYNN